VERKISTYYLISLGFLLVFFAILFFIMNPLLSGNDRVTVVYDYEYYEVQPDHMYVGGKCGPHTFIGLIVDVQSDGSIVWVELDERPCVTLLDEMNFVDDNVVEVDLGPIGTGPLRDNIVAGNRIEYMAFEGSINDVYHFDIFIDFSHLFYDEE